MRYVKYHCQHCGYNGYVWEGENPDGTIWGGCSEIDAGSKWAGKPHKWIKEGAWYIDEGYTPEYDYIG